MSLDRIVSSKTAFRLMIATVYMAFLIVAGTVLFHFTEYLDYGDSFYFTVVTLFSIGYGDIAPMTVEGEILTTLFIIFGLSVFLASVTIIGTWMVKQYSNRDNRLRRLSEAGDRRRKEAIYRWGERHDISRETLDKVIKNTIKENEEKSK